MTQPTERGARSSPDADAARRPALDRDPHGWAEVGLEEALGELRRLERRKTAWMAVAVAIFVLVGARGVVAITAPGWNPGGSALRMAAVLVVAMLAAIALVAARVRLGRRVDALRQEVSSLRLLRDALEHETAPVVVRDGSYRRPAEPGGFLRPALVVRTPLQVRAEPKKSVGSAMVTMARLATILAVGAVLVVVLLSRGDGSSVEQRWMFLDGSLELADLGFETPTREAGAWLLEEHDGATGGRALVNLAGAANERPATAVVGATETRDVRVRTRCKVSAERPDRACGLVFRYLSDGTHYVVRVDAAKGEIALSVVAGARERVLQVVPAQIEPDTWHDIGVHARGDHIAVSWNGSTVLDVHDSTIPSPGAVGLWAPSDCIAYFDELTVEALPSARPHSTDLLPFLLF